MLTACSMCMKVHKPSQSEVLQKLCDYLPYACPSANFKAEIAFLVLVFACRMCQVLTLSQSRAQASTEASLQLCESSCQKLQHQLRVQLRQVCRTPGGLILCGANYTIAPVGQPQNKRAVGIETLPRVLQSQSIPDNSTAPMLAIHMVVKASILLQEASSRYCKQQQGCLLR